jgi:hypothetical protein
MTQSITVIPNPALPGEESAFFPHGKKADPSQKHLGMTTQDGQCPACRRCFRQYFFIKVADETAQLLHCRLLLIHRPQLPSHIHYNRSRKPYLLMVE